MPVYTSFQQIQPRFRKIEILRERDRRKRENPPSSDSPGDLDSTWNWDSWRKKSKDPEPEPVQAWYKGWDSDTNTLNFTFTVQEPVLNIDKDGVHWPDNQLDQSVEELDAMKMQAQSVPECGQVQPVDEPKCGNKEARVGPECGGVGPNVCDQAQSVS